MSGFSGSRLGLLARLELRHAKSGLRWAFFAAGSDIEDERGFLDRAYQLYVLIFAAVVMALSWAQVVSLVEGAAAAIPHAGAVSLALLALAVPAVLLATGVAALRETPLRLSGPDIAWLARTVAPTELLAVQLVKVCVPAAVVGVLGGYLLGIPASAQPLTWSAVVAPLVVAARLGGLLPGLARSAALLHRRRAVSAVAGVLLVVAAAALLVSLPTLLFLVGLALCPLACGVAVLLAVAAFALAARADMAFVVDDNEVYAARSSLRFLSLVDAGAYKEACRRSRSSRRRAARHPWRFSPGRGAALGHGLVALLRQPSLLLGLLVWGAALVPSGVLLMATLSQPGPLVMWVFLAAMRLREPLAVAHVFREDCRVRLVRGLLPFGTFELLVLDSAAAFAVTFVASVAVTTPLVAALGGSVLAAVLLAVLVDALLLLSAGLDDPALDVRLGTLTLGGSAAAMAGLLAVALSSLASPWLAVVVAAAVDLLLVSVLRRGR